MLLIYWAYLPQTPKSIRLKGFDEKFFSKRIEKCCLHLPTKYA
jgi:hypothetical protein